MKSKKLSILFSAVVIALMSQKAVAQASNSPHELLQSGQDILKLGDPWQASILLKDALSQYSTLGDHLGVLETQIAQSELQHSLGQNLQACKTLVSALELEARDSCSPTVVEDSSVIDTFDTNLQAVTLSPLKTKALANLSFYFSALGNLEASERVIKRAEALETSDHEDLILLSKAHLERLFALRLRNQAVLDDSPALQTQLHRDFLLHAQDAFSLYGSLVGSLDPVISLKARLSWAELYSALDSFSQGEHHDSPLKEFQRRRLSENEGMLSALSRISFLELPRSEAIYGRLRVAELLLERQNSRTPVKSIYALVRASLGEARELKNIRGQSFALGILGRLYQLNNQRAEAQELFHHAINLSHSINMWDGAYQWQWMVAESLAEEGKRDEALEYYRRSVQSLEHVRSDLLPIDSELQFSFASEVAPVYREYIQLLLSGSDASNVDTALNTYNQLQLAELENYLRCGRLETVSVSEIKDAPPVLYIIELANQIEVILRKPNGQTVRHRPDNSVVRENISNLRYFTNGLQPKKLKLEASAVPISAIQSGKVLYQQLIRPIEQHLSKGQTVNLVLDTSLQSIPLALLYDGQRYLIDNYSTSLVLKDQLLPPRKLKYESSKVLLAGLSTLSPSLKALNDESIVPLPEVVTEVSQVESLTRQSRKLLDRQFTRERLDKELKSNYPIVHIASHGVFSSDPNKNVLYAWDSQVSAEYLQNILRDKRDFTSDSIELLVLSACQTAVGDERSVLGLAGMSVRAGARSTVASLWRVESESTALLMTYFYEGLSTGLSKAEALRQAQLDLKNIPEFSHPYFWAGFILVGSWL